VKHLFILLQCTYNELRDESEVAIIEKYWNIGRRYTEMLTRKTRNFNCLKRAFNKFLLSQLTLYHNWIVKDDINYI